MASKEKEVIDKNNKPEEEKILEEFLSTGVQYGRGKRYTHPSMRGYLLKTTKPIEIFDVRTTLAKMKAAVNLLVDLLQVGKTVLFVGITPATSKSIEDLAKLLDQPYMTFRWVGGFLTNFETIKSRLVYFHELLEKERSGLLDQYTPKERNKILHELEKMKQIYSGVKGLTKRPEAIFIVNLAFKSHKTAKKEALKAGLPIMALAGSDNDINGVTAVIPGNDKAPKSITTILGYLGRWIKDKLTDNGERIIGENQKIED